MLATTLGETGGDAVSMSMNLGYLVGTEIFGPVYCCGHCADLRETFVGYRLCGRNGNTVYHADGIAAYLVSYAGVGRSRHREFTEVRYVLLDNHHVFSNPRHCARRLESRFRRPGFRRWCYAVWRTVGGNCDSLLPNQDFLRVTFFGGIYSYPTFSRGGWRLPGQADKQWRFGAKSLLSISGIILVNRFIYLYLCA